MSRLASESKADRAPQRNAHRKRKMQEPPPTAAAAGLNKLKPSTVSLPPVGMPKQAQKQVASSVPAIVASIQRTGTCHPGSAASIGQSQLHSSGGLPANTVSQSSVSANKRAKHEQVNDSSTSYMHCLAQSTSAHHEDAETETDGSSHHLSAAQLPAHTTTSSSAFLSAPTKFFDPVKALPLTAHAPASSQGQAGILEEQKASPHRTAEQGIAQPAQSSVTASGCITPAAELLLAADNSMAALANAAAAASEGSAESSSSRAGTEDDKDAAAILRDLRSSPSPQPSPTEGQSSTRAIIATVFSTTCIITVACSLVQHIGLTTNGKIPWKGQVACACRYYRWYERCDGAEQARGQEEPTKDCKLTASHRPSGPVRSLWSPWQSYAAVYGL